MSIDAVLFAHRVLQALGKTWCNGVHERNTRSPQRGCLMMQGNWDRSLFMWRGEAFEWRRRGVFSISSQYLIAKCVYSDYSGPVLGLDFDATTASQEALCVLCLIAMRCSTMLTADDKVEVGASVPWVDFFEMVLFAYYIISGEKRNEAIAKLMGESVMQDLHRKATDCTVHFPEVWTPEVFLRFVDTQS